MTVQCGLIGGGNITRTHARAVRATAGAEVAAVYGENREKVAALAQEFGAKAYADFEHFLQHRPLDAVVIGSPSGLHAEQGIAAARQGLHVLVEKPIDITTERADALIAATDRARVKLGVLFQNRFRPGIVRVKALLDQGALGRLHLIDIRVKWYRPPEYYGASRWRGKLALDGGGALINQGIHAVDLALWLAGDVTRVQAQTRTAIHAMEGEDTAVAVLEFRSGALGVLQAATSVYPGYPQQIEIAGTEGTVLIEDDRVVRADTTNTAWHDIAAGASPQSASASSPVVDDFTAHQAALQDFLSAIGNDTAPSCDGREGRRSLALVEAIYASAQSGAEHFVDRKPRHSRP